MIANDNSEISDEEFNIEGHDSHLYCLLRNSEAFLESRLNPLFEEAKLIAEVAKDVGENRNGEIVNAAFAKTQSQGDLRMLLLCAVIEGQGFVSFESMYPVAVEGIAHDLKITRILPWSNGIEAVIVANTSCGMEVAFFDVLYYLNREKYSVGKTFCFSLAATAYQAGVAQNTTPATDGALFNICGYSTDVPRQREPTEFSQDGAVMLIPTSSNSRPDYSLYGPIKETVLTRYGGDDFHRMRVAIGRDCSNQEDSDILLYAANRVIHEGTLITSGQNIEASIWLQGYLAENRGLFDQLV